MIQLLYRRYPSRRSQKHPIEQKLPKLIKWLNILKQRIKKLKNTDRRNTKMIILLPNRTSQVKVATKMIMIEKKLNTQTEG